MPCLGTPIWHPNWGHAFGCTPESVLGGLSIFIMLASFQVEPLGITEHHAGVVAHGVAQGLVYEQNLVT